MRAPKVSQMPQSIPITKADFVRPEKQMIAYDGRELQPTKSGMKANTTLFLEKRKIYQWMVSPFLTCKQSASGSRADTPHDRTDAVI